jgi:hypothetical protein
MQLETIAALGQLDLLPVDVLASILIFAGRESTMLVSRAVRDVFDNNCTELEFGPNFTSQTISATQIADWMKLILRCPKLKQFGMRSAFPDQHMLLRAVATSCTYIEHLHISIESDVEMNLMAPELAQLTSLRSIGVNFGNNIDYKFQEFACALEQLTELQYLALDEICTDFAVVASAFGKLTKLQRISLGNIEMEFKDANAFASNIPGSLKELELFSCNINDDGAQALCQALTRLSNLDTLVMSHTVDIEMALGSLTGLTRLSLERELMTLGSPSLYRSLRRLTALKDLNIAGIVNGDGLSAALADLPHLQILTLSSGGDATWAAQVALLKELEELHIEDTNCNAKLGPKGCKVLVPALIAMSNRLKMLSFVGTKMGKTAGDFIKAIIEAILTHTKVYID